MIKCTVLIEENSSIWGKNGEDSRQMGIKVIYFCRLLNGFIV